MKTRILFPRLLVWGFALALSSGVFAQTSNNDRPRYAVRKTAAVTPRVPEKTGAVRANTDTGPAEVTATKSSAISLEARFQEDLFTALESHVGAPYHYNRTGPDSFDCSGLVWRAFQDIGIDFQRGPARSYWAVFTAPPSGEEFKFGNLVFFSGLRHVGIVVDEKGFYHSARHGGVMYSPFNEYWLSRIDGFRRVPLAELPAKTPVKRVVKPTAIVPVVDDHTP